MKKTVAIIIHLPAATKTKLETIKNKLKLDCISDAIIAVVNTYTLKQETP